MYTIDQIEEALRRLFSHNPPRKAIAIQKIVLIIADLYDCPPENILIPDLKTALRRISFAKLQPKLRGSDHISWVFVKQVTVPADKPAKKQRAYKDKPLIESQKLKPAK